MEPPEYRIPPTHAVYSSPKGYEPTQAAPPPLWYDIPPIPPPPPPEPKMCKHHWRIVGFIVLLLCLVGVGIFAEWASIQPKTDKRIAPTPLATLLLTSTQATPTINPYYTADEIYRDMETFTEVGVGNDASGRSDPQTFTEHLHGRCLLLISSLTTGSPWSGYKQAIDQYCI